MSASLQRPRKGKVNNLNIITYGGDKRCAYAAQLLEASAQVPASKIILLPTPSTKDGIRVTDTNDELLPIFEKLEKGDFIFGYGLPTELVKIAEGAGAVATDLSISSFAPVGLGWMRLWVCCHRAGSLSRL